MFKIIVVSDRIYDGRAKDVSGVLAEEIIAKAGYSVSKKVFVPNDYVMIMRTIMECVEEEPSIVIVIGGTGIGPRDISVDVVERLFEKELPGFGELFREFSTRLIGVSSWLSRATAGIIRNMLVAVVPGKPNAVELALKELILPEADHIISMLKGLSHWDEK